MANIMITDVCNLKCPYCFANEFVNKDTTEISEENFDKAVDFIVGDGSHTSIGLIGGEPTVHSKFEYLVRKLICDNRVKKIVIYTNGIIIDRYWDVITHPKIHLLINCNSPQDIGIKNFEHLCSNLDYLLNKRGFIDNTTLGINMYNPYFEYQYLMDLLIKYSFHHVRVSITVPNVDTDRNNDAHTYFELIKPRLLQFFDELLSNEIIPNFDCNKIPSCLMTKNELKEFDKYLDNPFIKANISKSNISHNRVVCGPVIDIRQDLTAVRCFGLSECTKQKINDFETITDLKNYYIRTIDAFAYNTVYSSKCNECYKRKTLKCTGGCLAFKINDMLDIQKYSNKKIQNFSKQ